jgi:hypothetical protein
MVYLRKKLIGPRLNLIYKLAVRCFVGNTGLRKFGEWFKHLSNGMLHTYAGSFPSRGSTVYFRLKSMGPKVSMNMRKRSKP